jgi:hypothetical protein
LRFVETLELVGGSLAGEDEWVEYISLSAAVGSDEVDLGLRLDSGRQSKWVSLVCVRGRWLSFGIGAGHGALAGICLFLFVFYGGRYGRAMVELRTRDRRMRAFRSRMLVRR